MKEKEIKEELKSVSDRYYARLLEQKGFVSYKNDLLNWYKIYNGVICHFHLLVAHSRLPMLIQAWWFHPTYIPATLNLPVSWVNYDNCDEPISLYVNKVNFETHFVENGRRINVPRLPQLGAERLEEEFFPQIAQLQTRDAVYAQLKHHIQTWWAERTSDYPFANLTTPDFADMALMMNDTALFPSCIERVERSIRISRLSHSIQSAATSVTGRNTELLEAQLKALKGIEVERYIELLKMRKACFFKRYNLQDNFDL